MSTAKSYGQILKAASVMGGAASINLLLGMVRVKFAAVFIGTIGVGLIANFTALQGFVGTLAGLGLQSSAVREIAAAVAKGDHNAVGRAVLTLRRLCWLTGFAGMSAMVVLSPFIGQLTMGHRDHAFDIAALGFVILFGNLAGGQLALIQGMRRIGDMARANVFGAACGTLAAIGFYTTLGQRGIIPALITISGGQLALSFYFARRVPVPKVSLTWRETYDEAGGMVRLGLVMMWSGLMGSGVTYLTVALITRQEGTQAVGLYSGAAFALSGVFVNFVLGAMGADYYPRLTAVASDKLASVRMVNEQTEVGLLLALPGLLATLALAPWIVQVFYTDEFRGAVELLQWFILGCLGRVISWPLGFVMLAQAKGRWYVLTETSFNFLHVAFVALALQLYGVVGVAIAFVVMYLGYIVGVHQVSRRLIDFTWSTECLRLGALTVAVLCLVFIASRVLPLWASTWLGLSFTLIVSVLCLRGLVARGGSEHRIVSAVTRLPGGKFFISAH